MSTGKQKNPGFTPGFLIYNELDVILRYAIAHSRPGTIRSLYLVGPHILLTVADLFFDPLRFQ